MIDMLAKILIFGLLATTIVASPVGPAEDEDDLPVYTEKVMPNKPTQVPKFGAKKASTAFKAIPEKLPSENRQPHDYPQHTPSTPKAFLKTTKPIRDNVRPVRRIQKVSAPPLGYNEVKPSSKSEYDDHSLSFSAANGLGVEYAPEVEVPASHEDPVDDYKPAVLPQRSSGSRQARHPVRPAPRAIPRRTGGRIQHQSSTDIGSAVGNAPQIQYAAAPHRFVSASAQAKDIPDYGYASNAYDEKPQPYIFGYELQDEHGSTQSRKEQGDDYGNKRGSYGYTDGHGIYRQVEYIADEHGFRAVVKTNEPGTENQNPADVQMLSEAEKY